MPCETTRAAILTAHKCSGKSTVARQVGAATAAGRVGLLKHDSAVFSPLAQEFGRGRNAEDHLDLWSRADPLKLETRLVALHTQALQRIGPKQILAEGWAYHVRAHRRALYQALGALAPGCEIALVEIRLPPALLIARVIAAQTERRGQSSVAQLPPDKQLRYAHKRIAAWNSRFEPPDAAETARLSAYRQFDSSEAAAQFLRHWLT